MYIWIKLSLFITYFLSNVDTDYLNKRDQLLQLDSRSQIGYNIKLSDKEKLVNAILLSLKRKELDIALSSDRSLQEQNFLLVKDEIENSDVFKIVKRMPKGAVLHVHDTSMASYRSLIEKWTYDERCFMCYDQYSQKIVEFRISLILPTDIQNDCHWVPVQDIRANYSSKKEFDDLIVSHLTFAKQDVGNNQNKLWKKFESIFQLLNGLVTYHEAFRDYYRFGLEELVDDNVQYVEIRALLPPLYYLNGTVGKGGRETFQAYIQVQEEFLQTNNKTFYGAKYIFSALRSLSNDVIQQNVLEAIKMFEDFPKHVAGFDLVGQEDKGSPLLTFKDELLLPKKLGKELKYFFHAGETDWQGESVDANLFDAILLNTTRIGHAFAMMKHPFLKKQAKLMNISVELCPISNQVLGLVKDLRDHPATSLLTEDQPITVNSDDPAIWDASPSSHDMYQLLMGMTPANAGLEVLKKLALNSISYSDLDEQGKNKLFVMWNSKWDVFLDEVIKEYQLE